MRLLMLLAFIVPGGMAYILPVDLMRRHMEVRSEIAPSSHTLAEEVHAGWLDYVEEVAPDVCPAREPLWTIPSKCYLEVFEPEDHCAHAISAGAFEPFISGWYCGSRQVIDRITIFDSLDKAVICALLLVFVSLAAWKMRRRTDAPHLPISDSEELSLTEFYRVKESLIRFKRPSQISEEMRAVLVNWAIDVHLGLKLVQETLYLTVYVIDKYLESEEVPPQDLLLVGVTAILLASKYEEVNPPTIPVLALATKFKYSKRDMIGMESRMAEAIQYRLTVPTIYSFLLCYHKAEYADDKIVQLSCFVAERMLQEVSMLDYLPSVIACSAIYIARKNTGRTCWSPTLEEHTKYHEEDLIPCLTEMSRILKAEGDLDAVKKKFSSSKFGSVATMEIAVLPDDLP